MGFDWTITLGNMLTILGMAAAVIGAYFVLRGTANKALEKAVAAEARAHLVHQELNAFKLEVTKTYATAETIKEVEERVVSAINRLGDRLDRAFERGRES